MLRSSGTLHITSVLWSCLHEVLLTCMLLLEQPVSVPDPQINDKLMLVVAALLHCCQETACRQGGVPHALMAYTHRRHLCKGGDSGSARNHTIPAQMFPGHVALPAFFLKEKSGKVEGGFQPAPLAFANKLSNK